jgi:hypothetical protein
VVSFALDLLLVGAIVGGVTGMSLGFAREVDREFATSDSHTAELAGRPPDPTRRRKHSRLSDRRSPHQFSFPRRL